MPETGSTSGAAGQNTERESPGLIKVSITDARNMIPDFDGNPDDLHKFIGCCDTLFSTAKNVADQTLFLNLLKTKLNGPAYDVLKYKNVSTWDELRQELNDQFSDTKARVTIQGELMRLRQALKEDIKEFAQRVTKLLAELNNATYNETSNSGARDYLLQENEKTAIRVFEDGIRNKQLGVIAKAKGEVTLKKLINYVLEHSNRLEESQAVPHELRTALVCEICNDRGHGKETWFRKEVFPTSNTNSSTRKKANRIICSCCHKPNHDIRECRSRLRNERFRECPAILSASSTNRHPPRFSPPTDSYRENVRKIGWATPT